MRKGLATTVGACTVAVGVYGLRRGLWTRELVAGTFPNGMGYARLGTGAKSLLWIGGPSVGAPQGLYLTMMTWVLRPFVQDGFSVWLVSQRPHLPKGHTVADMAEDYATLIAEEFDGRVDLVIGHSTGGMIGFYLAARYPDRFGHIAIAGAGCEWSEQADAANLEFARLLSEDRKHEAAAVLVRFNAPDIRLPGLVGVLASVTARVSLAAPYIPSDVMIDAEALHTFEPRRILPDILVPMLLVGGDRDRWFAKEIYEETAQLIPGCTLKLYQGKDHLGMILNRTFPQDVMEFVRRPRPLRP